jgi:hypothetical protein
VISGVRAEPSAVAGYFLYYLSLLGWKGWMVGKVIEKKEFAVANLVAGVGKVGA